jgi:hypothetical protein
MPRRLADILEEEFDRMINSQKFKDILELMNNINPSERCMLCGADCGKAHMICVECYAREKVNQMGERR